MKKENFNDLVSTVIVKIILQNPLGKVSKASNMSLFLSLLNDLGRGKIVRISILQ